MSIQTGEIVGLLGENGAGKSTFLSILAGRTQPDTGHLALDGDRVSIESPKDAQRLGISIVFQHFSLIPTFTVREQLRLAGWTGFTLPDLLASRLTGDEIIGNLSLGERQLVEISRALVSKPRFLLLDEPTSILTTAEVHGMFGIMQELRIAKTGVVLVTHKLHEAMAICDRILVLRRGQIVDAVERTAEGWPAGCEQGLLRSMFGTEHGETLPEDRTTIQVDAERESSVLVQFEHLSTHPRPEGTPLRDISFDIRRGEIAAVVGVDGQGQRELMEVCAGYTKATGRIALHGQALAMGDALAFRHAGIACLTDDRIEEGAVPGFSVEENLALKRQREWPFSRFGIIRQRGMRQNAQREIATWNIEPPQPSMPIDYLSGGNIQKVLLARELAIASSFLIVNKPSQGLDARTRHLVWDAIREFTTKGGSVLLLTTDLDEAMTHSHRIAVMYEGRLSPLHVADGVERSVLERLMVTGWL